MASAIWTPQAELDLENILYYVAIEQRRPEVANRFAHEFDNQATQAAAWPGSGSRHPVTLTDWRYRKHRRWLMFYRPHSEGVEIMRVIDAVRDLPVLFRHIE